MALLSELRSKTSLVFPGLLAMRIPWGSKFSAARSRSSGVKKLAIKIPGKVMFWFWEVGAFLAAFNLAVAIASLVAG